MQLMRAAMIGGSAPYREAVSDRLRERGYKLVAVDDLDEQERHVAIIYCDDETSWQILEERAGCPPCVAVAVIPSLVLDLYIRALVVGAAGVIYVDTSSAVTAEVVQAAVDGEVLLPRQAAQNMAALARREHPPSDLDESERRLLLAVATGRTIVGLAKEMHYSERTVRRHLHSLYIKLGVKNRAEAIACAARLGLTD